MQNQNTDNIASCSQYQIAIMSFYSFVEINDLEILQYKILLLAKKKYINGTILIANEGFNGSISGEAKHLQLLVDMIREITDAKEINCKVNFCDTHPFSKIKVRIKKEIVALKHNALDVLQLKGKYIKSNEWDEFILQDDVITIDTRNDYEVQIGTFAQSINPKISTFSEFPQWAEDNLKSLKSKKVAMFCTGGIRCEKSTALLKSLGINEVYHLEGGILQYLEDTKNKNQSWKGECFVFDDRGAVSSDLSPSEGFWVPKGQTAKSISQTKAKTL